MQRAFELQDTVLLAKLNAGDLISLTCGRARVRARALVCACVRARVRACVRACVRAYANRCKCIESNMPCTSSCKCVVGGGGECEALNKK